MAFHLEQVVPWGRSFSEYVSMFALGKDDLRKKLLGCGDGPAGFNCIVTKGGGSIVSVDPLYQFSLEAIAKRIQETFDVVLEQTRQNSHEFVWNSIASVEALGEIRMRAMSDFLADYSTGKREGRYLYGQLPRLPFSDNAFDLALCSHFLFLYSKQLDLAFHLESLRELCRVAREVRVFPLLELGAIRSRHIEEVIATLTAEAYEVSVECVGYEFQRGGNEMLRVKRIPNDA